METYLVIGAGISGSVIARELADRGCGVTLWDRRKQIGGNMHDDRDAYGILVHRYGPHVFHTEKRELYAYMLRFAEWEPYRLACGAQIDGRFTPTPFNYSTIDMLYPETEAEELKSRLGRAFPGRETASVLEVMACGDAIVRGYGELLFAKDYRPYTAKQWGLPPEEIDPSVLRRVPVRLSYGGDYFSDAWQMMPRESYAVFFRNLLGHPNIKVELGVEALDRLSVSGDGRRLLLDGEPCPVPVVYTGALDELFRFAEGRLPYRSLRFEWIHEDRESFQPYAVVGYPQAEGFTRITEYRKLPFQQADGTTYAKEYPLPYEPGKAQEPYYPVLTEESRAQYARYRKRAERLEHFYFCGRLADFCYYNMDQALERALKVCQGIFEGSLR